MYSLNDGRQITYGKLQKELLLLFFYIIMLFYFKIKPRINFVVADEKVDVFLRKLKGNLFEQNGLLEHEVFLSSIREDTSASVTSTSLLQAIKESEIAVIVLSIHYANSQWCLDELVNIMDCRSTTGKIVLPVFYDVDPSEVRHQKGKFGKAFESLLNRISKEEEDKSLKWRHALCEVAALAGIVVMSIVSDR